MFWSDPSSTSIFHVCEQRRLWRDCANAQARLSLRCSPMWQVPFSHELAHAKRNRIPLRYKFIGINNILFGYHTYICKRGSDSKRNANCLISLVSYVNKFFDLTVEFCTMSPIRYPCLGQVLMHSLSQNRRKWKLKLPHPVEQFK